MSGWRVHVLQDESTFLRDQLKIFMAFRDEEGIRMVMPVAFELGELVSNSAIAADPLPVEPTVMPRELAEQLFSQLGYALLQVAEPYEEIKRLRRELAETKGMLSSLISGIGRLGGKHGD